MRRIQISLPRLLLYSAVPSKHSHLCSDRIVIIKACLCVFYLKMKSCQKQPSVSSASCVLLACPCLEGYDCTSDRASAWQKGLPSGTHAVLLPCAAFLPAMANRILFAPGSKLQEKDQQQSRGVREAMVASRVSRRAPVLVVPCVGISRKRSSRIGPSV